MGSRTIAAVSNAELQVSLDVPLPREVAVGAGTALFVAGTCFCPTAGIDSLELTVDGEPQPLIGHGMPRLDFFASLHPRIDPFESRPLRTDPGSTQDPLLLSYRSGFWGLAKLRPRGPGAERTLGLRARLDGDRAVDAALSTAPQAGDPEPPMTADWPEGSTQPSVAICMATHNPPKELFRRQIDSIRTQSHGNWICFISDDCSSGESFAELQRALDGDRRFVLSRSPRRLGFFENFERALGMAPRDTQFVAMADQDDFWQPDKLATLLEEIGDAQLVYSDARVVTRDGQLISETYWSERRNNHSNLLSLLVANAVSGAASLFRRELLDYALPFPPSQFAHFHDHWLGLTALALGEIAFVDRPLYDYVQHRHASLGHAAANRMTALRQRLLHQSGLRERVRMWRLHYFVDVCRLMQVATILELRCSDRMTSAKRDVLRRFLGTDASLTSLASLGARGVRELVGESETLGAEWMLFHAFAWRRLLRASARARPTRHLRLDAAPPPSLALQPTRRRSEGAASEVADKIAPLDLAVSDRAPARINLLIPTVDLQHFFGGYIAKLNLARRLAERGHRVRLLTVDPVGPLAPNWKQELESYSGLTRFFERVELAFGRGPSPIEVSPVDGFIATTWWTAHIASDAVRTLDGGRFVYLIQEYEPFTFPMGTYAALAAQSYRFEHFAVFSTEFLQAYFREHRIGVYEHGVKRGDRDSLTFQNALTRPERPTVEQLAGRSSRRLLFYARPEPHAARNMFELGVLALGRALDEGVFTGGWELRGIGTVRGARRIALGDGAALELLPRVEQSAYARLLHDHDLGLALMYTPHPSLVPIEMASAGMVAVTNSFENKTPQAMRAISPNLIAAEPSVEGIVGALRGGVAAAQDYRRRVRGSEVRWSMDWSESFDDKLLARVASALGYGER